MSLPLPQGEAIIIDGGNTVLRVKLKIKNRPFKNTALVI
jgi:hypothetical protein